MLPRPIQNLIDEFAKLPSVGPRQAARFVFHLLNQPKEEIEKFAKKLFVLKKVNYCQFCNRAIELPSSAKASPAFRSSSATEGREDRKATEDKEVLNGTFKIK